MLKNSENTIEFRLRVLLSKIISRIRDILIKAWVLVRVDLRWLYGNRFLRMDANVPINNEQRRDFHKDRYEFAADYLKNLKVKNMRILDAACGTGYGSDILKSVQADEIVGVDICSKTIGYARKKYGNNNCIFRVADVTICSEFKGDVFDAVVSFETIEHIENPVIFLENVFRVLKKDGYLIISTPNKWGITRDHKFDYDYELLRKHLKQFFTIEDMYVQNSGSMDLWVNRGAHRRIERVSLENRDQAECFIAVCKKGSNEGVIK